MNVYFHTFGCKANQYDTEVVRQAFADQGAVLVDDPAAADLEVLTEDYLSVYLPVADWDGRPRFDITVT